MPFTTEVTAQQFRDKTVLKRILRTTAEVAQMTKKMVTAIPTVF